MNKVEEALKNRYALHQYIKSGKTGGQKGQPKIGGPLKSKSRIPGLIRKHFFKREGKSLDVVWLTAILNMEDKSAEMFKTDNNNLTGRKNDPNASLGAKYIHAGVNIWGSQHKPNVEGAEAKKEDLGSLGELFHEEGQKMEFYKHIKNANHTKEDEMGQNKWQISKAYFDRCNKRREIPCPTFIKLNSERLFLSEFKIKDSQAENLREFLIASRDDAEKQIKSVFIDDCGMTDF